LSNQPILSANQEEANERFRNEHQQRQRHDSVNDREESDPKEQFKSQAINRRASKFGHAMQMTIIDAETFSDKQNMFECADVLNEVLKAVEQGKKALRLDFTPYKLYELRKKK
jgi:hypothetical protein